MILVPIFDLKFLHEMAADRNFKSAALARDDFSLKHHPALLL
jgi:hypothetical protein